MKNYFSGISPAPKQTPSYYNLQNKKEANSATVDTSYFVPVR